jgi:hypothetical protein
MYSFVPAFACHSLVWTLLLFALNLAWEFAQLPLYSLGAYEGWPRSAYAVLHCTLGDAGIALGSYALAAALVGRVDWPMRRPAMGIAIAMSAALAYTVWAEWRNVYVVGNWAYAGSMPTIGGIGVAPLLQWIALPLVALPLIRRAGRRRPFCGTR